MTYATRLLVLGLAECALASCVGAPPPLPVAPQPEAQWSANDPALIQGEVKLDWWRAFGSSELDSLVAEALESNHQIAAAQANLKAARALAGEARRARGITGGLQGGVRRLREAAQSQPPIFITPDPFPDQTIADIGGEFAWEIDLAGGQAKNARAARADADAALWESRQIKAAIAAQVVRAWLDLARSQAEADLIRERLVKTDSMLALAQKRVAEGAALPADYAPLKQVRAGLARELPLAEHAGRNALRRIAVLLAKDPVAFVAKSLPARATGIATPQTLTLHEPRTLLRLRPDVQAAEARLIAAYERAGASRAALYPSLSLGAGAGLIAAPRSLDEAGALRFSIGPSINWGVFNLGQVRARIRAADAESEAAAAQWQNTLLVALEEADGTVDLWRSARAACDQARLAQEASSLVATTARARYRAGAIGAFELAEAEADLITAEMQLLSATSLQREAWAQAQLALGAGWRPDLKNDE